MKTYKINNEEVNADQIRAIIKDNPELLEEKKINNRYFFPKEDYYYYIDVDGEVMKTYTSTYVNEIDEHNISTGNCYRTKKEAELDIDKQKAIVSCWKWALENAPFEPDWSNEDESKYYAYYDFGLKELDSIYADEFKNQFTLPYFESQEDCEKFIEANKANLELLFTK